MTTIEDAKLLWRKNADGDWVDEDDITVVWWTDAAVWSCGHTRDADLSVVIEAALSATPYARRLLAVLREVEALRARLRTTAQTPIAEVGLAGTERAEEAAKRAVAEIARLRERVDTLLKERAETFPAVAASRAVKRESDALRRLVDGKDAEIARLRARIAAYDSVRDAARNLLAAFDARDPIGAEWRDLRTALAATEGK